MLTIKDSPANLELSAKKAMSVLRLNTMNLLSIKPTLMDLLLANSEMIASIQMEPHSSNKLARAGIMLKDLDIAQLLNLPVRYFFNHYY